MTSGCVAVLQLALAVVIAMAAVAAYLLPGYIREGRRYATEEPAAELSSLAVQNLLTHALAQEDQEDRAQGEGEAGPQMAKVEGEAGERGRDEGPYAGQNHGDAGDVRIGAGDGLFRDHRRFAMIEKRKV